MCVMERERGGRGECVCVCVCDVVCNAGVKGRCVMQCYV